VIIYPTLSSYENSASVKTKKADLKSAFAKIMTPYISAKAVE